MGNRWRSFAKQERAAALVEFAIVAPLLFLLVSGIVDFGRALFTLNNLTSAVREGARFASVQSNPSNTGPIVTRVQNYVTSFGGSGSYTVNVTLDAAPPNTQFITVQITGYAFTPITPLPSWVPGMNSITFSPSAVYRWEQAP